MQSGGGSRREAGGELRVVGCELRGHALVLVVAAFAATRAIRRERNPAPGAGLNCQAYLRALQPFEVTGPRRSSNVPKGTLGEPKNRQVFLSERSTTDVDR